MKRLLLVAAGVVAVVAFNERIGLFSDRLVARLVAMEPTDPEWDNH